MTSSPGPGDLELAGAGMRFLLTPVVGPAGRGMQVEVDHPGQGHAAVVLEPHEATRVRDHLTAWLATLPAPTG